MYFKPKNKNGNTTGIKNQKNNISSSLHAQTTPTSEPDNINIHRIHKANGKRPSLKSSVSFFFTTLHFMACSVVVNGGKINTKHTDSLTQNQEPLSLTSPSASTDPALSQQQTWPLLFPPAMRRYSPHGFQDDLASASLVWIFLSLCLGIMGLPTSVPPFRMPVPRLSMLPSHGHLV